MSENLDSILLEEDIAIARNQINAITNPVSLHLLAKDYNWDNGFEIPFAILSNENCDLGTALMMFFLADGYTALADKDSFEQSPFEEWKHFITELKDKILNENFNKSEIAFQVPLTEVQIYKLKKDKSVPEIFTNDLSGLLNI